jgi:hypothetical protein
LNQTIVHLSAFCVQGKGAMMTYFLHSKEGFACHLPDLTRALPLAEHSFK